MVEELPMNVQLQNVTDKASGRGYTLTLSDAGLALAQLETLSNVTVPAALDVAAVAVEDVAPAPVNATPAANDVAKDVASEVAAEPATPATEPAPSPAGIAADLPADPAAAGVAATESHESERPNADLRLNFHEITRVSLEPGDPHELLISSDRGDYAFVLVNNPHYLVHKLADLLRLAVAGAR